MSEITNADKLKMIDREVAFMKKQHPKLVERGQLQAKFADYKIKVFEAISEDYRNKNRDG